MSFDPDTFSLKHLRAGLMPLNRPSSFHASLCLILCVYFTANAGSLVLALGQNDAEGETPGTVQQSEQVFWIEWLEQTEFKFPCLRDKLFKKSVDRCPDDYAVEYTDYQNKEPCKVTFTKNGTQTFELRTEAIGSFVIHNENLYCLCRPIGSGLLHVYAYELSSGNELWRHPIVYHRVALRNHEIGELRLVTVDEFPRVAGTEAIVMHFSCDWSDYIEVFDPQTGETLAKKVVRDGGKGIPAMFRKKE